MTHVGLATVASRLSSFTKRSAMAAIPVVGVMRMRDAFKQAFGEVPRMLGSSHLCLSRVRNLATTSTPNIARTMSSHESEKALAGTIRAEPAPMEQWDVDPSSSFTRRFQPKTRDCGNQSAKRDKLQFSALSQGVSSSDHLGTIDGDFHECLRHVLLKFDSPISYAFAYGSGVIPQSPAARIVPEAAMKTIHPQAPDAVAIAQGGSPKMIDFIFGVTDAHSFHSRNIAQHRDHYSALGYLGSRAVSTVQEYWGAGVYFNTYINVDGILIKYGVTTIDNLKNDLLRWKTLYLAGRLHKPVRIICDNSEISLAYQANLKSALQAALLLLPSRFTEEELYSTIAAMSYQGDPRMSFGTENPHKVANIVSNNMPRFRELYAPHIELLSNIRYLEPIAEKPSCIEDPHISVNIQLEQDMDPTKRGILVCHLPKTFRTRLYSEYQKRFDISDPEFESMKKESAHWLPSRIANDPELRKVLLVVIRKTINWPSITQTLKGPLTAGFTKTMRYLGEKMAKYREGSRR